jgi:hypothetical protein
MSGPAIAMMVFVLGVVWGGFGLLLWRSMKLDRER